MYSDKFYLSAEDILEKEFKIDARGYRPQEVDKYLDMIIRDYTEYNSIIQKLETDIKNLTADNGKLKQELRNLRIDVESHPVEESRVNNVDLLRRISQLEKVVFGKDE